MDGASKKFVCESGNLIRCLAFLRQRRQERGLALDGHGLSRERIDRSSDLRGRERLQRAELFDQIIEHSKSIGVGSDEQSGKFSPFDCNYGC